MARVLGIVAACLLLGSTALAEEKKLPSNYEHLKEYGDAIVGKWVGEFPVDFDFPPIVKKGDIAKFNVASEWILNKNAIETRFSVKVNGVTIAENRALTGWDTSAKRIVSFGFGSIGGRGQEILEKRGENKWFAAGTGSGPEGHFGAGMEIITFDGKDSYKSTMIGRLSPKGERLPDSTVEFKRVK